MLEMKYWRRAIREVGEGQALPGVEAELLPRPLGVLVEPRDDRVGRVAHLAHLDEIGARVVLRAARHRRAAQHHRLAQAVGARDRRLDERALHVHAGEEDRVGPGELLSGRFPRVLVHEAHLPRLREIGRDHQQALRRHEGADPPAEERVGVVEGAEGGSVARGEAEDAPAVPGRVAGAHQARGTGRSDDDSAGGPLRRRSARGKAARRRAW
jgi:hypothetical protein